MTNPNTATQESINAIQSGSRTALAQAITLIESKRADHREQAKSIIQQIIPLTGNSIRVGITGVPGAGKSTLIDQLGMNLTAIGKKVAVLTIDPSSTRSGGSILGDKTRMTQLVVNKQAFIRPSPTAGTLGGVAAKTRETMLLCEAAGFDVILVETVGIGQSETTVEEMVDFFLTILISGAGDELQGIKKGVLEISDMIVVNKADGEGKTSAESAASNYRAALNILAPKSTAWIPPVITVSGLKNQNLDTLWNNIEKFQQIMSESRKLTEKRKLQQINWFWSLLNDQIQERIQNNQKYADKIEKLQQKVGDGKVIASVAVDEIIDSLNL